MGQSALDTDTEHDVMRAIEDLYGSTTILIIAHRHSTVEKYDYLYKLDRGKIVAKVSRVQFCKNKN